jgi:rhomboid protease GluP
MAEMTSEPSSETEIRRCRRRSEGDDWVYVLHALGIPHRLVRLEIGYALLVTSADAQRASTELDEFAAEERAWPPPDVLSSQLPGGSGGALLYCYILLSLYAAQRNRAWGLDWLQEGRSHAYSLLNGEWWRSITALCLHGDLAHLLGNLVFGSLFGYLLSRQLGSGIAWLAILLAGGAGNICNALLQAGTHRSIGASTAVFGAVGLLMALQWRRYGRLHPTHRRRWTPAIIGLFFLGYLGTSGENTDVMAHVWGAICGAVGGLALNFLSVERPPRSLQAIAVAAALALIALCWYLAFKG